MQQLAFSRTKYLGTISDYREHECSSKNIAKITISRSCVHVYIALQIVLHLASKVGAVMIENFGISFTQLKTTNLLQWLLITFCNNVFL